MSIIGCKCTIS